MGEIIEPVAAIGEPALIIIRWRGGLGASAGDVVIAHVGEAVAERHNPRDLVALRSAAGKRRSSPARIAITHVVFVANARDTIGSQTPFVNVRSIIVTCI